jgi:large subunit ribosomal protein L13
MIETHPEEIIELAVRRMLPKSKLGKAMFTKLKVFRGPTHTHGAQKPEALKV